ncbi:hypothetical protein ALC60_12485 [Trachymyrmex zeteki]|uniref:Uncharacterized protein n=1 Tax=Mycetomoellerius zeteki TaxID=64791 RepID=A0A151WKM2_9HYME|nr:hypothetical protein ALC60_12485 [Trachymyrmex zeteki]
MEGKYFFPTSIKVNQLCTFVMHCDAINILCDTLARQIRRPHYVPPLEKTRHRFRKFLPFLQHINSLRTTSDLSDWEVGHRKDVRAQSETENFHGHGPDLVTRYHVYRVLCRESGIDYKKETGYRIKAIPRFAVENTYILCVPCRNHRGKKMRFVIDLESVPARTLPLSWDKREPHVENNRETIVADNKQPGTWRAGATSV